MTEEITNHTYINKTKERLYKALDFYKIIDAIGAYFCMEDSMEYFLLHRPKFSVQEVVLIQKKAQEYFLRSQVRDYHVNTYIKSIMKYLSEAHKRTIRIEELRDIVVLVYSINTYIKWLSETKGVLSENKSACLTMPHSISMKLLERALLQYFDTKGNLLYNTIPALKKIQAQRSSYHKKRNNIASSFIQTNGNICMSKTPTIKSERLVIPINTSYKSQVEGIIHGVSASAQTVFIEIKPLYEVNNDIELLDLEEEKVLYEIAKNLTETIVEHSASLREAYQHSIEFDVIQAQSAFGATYKGVFPHTNNDAQSEHNEYDIVLKNAIHPLIANCVPITIQCKTTQRQVILTGPNAGGKTIVLKTLGILSLLHQCGIVLPVEDGASLPVFETICMVIGDSQNLSEGESTFSAHLKEIHNALPTKNNVDGNHLLLFDEMCRGTDDQEGGALAWGILEYILQHKHYYTFVTTHATLLKYYAVGNNAVEIAALERNEKRAYNIVYGATGNSEAMSVASRIGMSTHIIETQKHILKEHGHNTHELMNRFHTLIVEAEEKQEAIQILLEKNKAEQKDLSEWERYLKDKEVHLKRNNLQEGYGLLQSLKAHIKTSEKKARELSGMIEHHKNTPTIETRQHTMYERLFAGAGLDRVGANAEINTGIENISKKTAAFSLALKNMEDEIESDTNTQRPTQETIEEGDEVLVLNMGMDGGMKGTVLQCLDNQKYKVRVGIITLTLHRKNIKKEADKYHSKYINEKQDEKFIIEKDSAYAEGQSKNQSNSQYSIEEKDSIMQPKLYIDVRGKNVEESITIIETHLNNAVVSKIYAFSIIHGKGTGALSRAIHAMLKNHSLVIKFDFASYEDGGAGKTIVHLD